LPGSHAPAERRGRQALCHHPAAGEQSPRAIGFSKRGRRQPEIDQVASACWPTPYVRNNEKDAAKATLDRISRLGHAGCRAKTQVAAQRLRIGQSGRRWRPRAATELAPQAIQPGLLLVLAYLDCQQESPRPQGGETMRAPHRATRWSRTCSARSRSLAAIRRGARAFEAALKLKPDFLPAQHPRPAAAQRAEIRRGARQSSMPFSRVTPAIPPPSSPSRADLAEGRKRMQSAG